MTMTEAEFLEHCQQLQAATAKAQAAIRDDIIAEMATMQPNEEASA